MHIEPVKILRKIATGCREIEGNYCDNSLYASPLLVYAYAGIKQVLKPN